MTLRGRWNSGLLFIALTFTGPQPEVRAGLLDEARRCTGEVQRLERLACFDAVFGTPISDSSQVQARMPVAVRSERWRQAYATTGSPHDTGVASYRDTGRAAGQLVTVSALGVEPPRPRLVLQCHNNITELTLMMPRPLSEERVRLAIGTQTMVWRVRDEGFVLSGGRGLPSIRIVKSLLAGPSARVDSATGGVDGLLFDLAGFADAIRPLRESCGW